MIPANIASLLTAPMNIYPNAVDGLVSEVLARIKSGEKAIMPTTSLHSVSSGVSSSVSTGSTTEETQTKKVMVIPCHSFVSCEDIPNYGILGTKSIQALIKAGNANEEIVGFVLHINNPGGTVLNTTETARMISQNSKPVVACIEHLGASSGYYLAMACQHILATGPTTLVGNIGTKSSGIDMKGIFEKLGAKSWEIFATESFDKDLGFNAALAGDAKKYQESILNPYAEMFMADVRAMRPAIPEEALHGMVYLADKAIEMNLIDGIGSMEDAIQKVVELAGLDPADVINNVSPFSSNIIMNKVLMKIPSILVPAAKLLGSEVEEVTEAEASNAALVALQGSIKVFGEENEALKAEKVTLTGELATAKTAEAAATKKATDLEANLATVTAELASRKMPGTPIIPAAKGDDPIISEDLSSKYTLAYE